MRSGPINDEDIWDSIAAKNLEMPMWQKRELGRRYKEYREGRLELHDWEDVHESLRKKYRGE